MENTGRPRTPAGMSSSAWHDAEQLRLLGLKQSKLPSAWAAAAARSSHPAASHSAASHSAAAPPARPLGADATVTSTTSRQIQPSSENRGAVPGRPPTPPHSEGPFQVISENSNGSNSNSLDGTDFWAMKQPSKTSRPPSSSSVQHPLSHWGIGSKKAGASLWGAPARSSASSSSSSLFPASKTSDSALKKPSTTRPAAAIATTAASTLAASSRPGSGFHSLAPSSVEVYPPARSSPTRTSAPRPSAANVAASLAEADEFELLEDDAVDLFGDEDLILQAEANAVAGGGGFVSSSAPPPPAAGTIVPAAAASRHPVFAAMMMGATSAASTTTTRPSLFSSAAPSSTAAAAKPMLPFPPPAPTKAPSKATKGAKSGKSGTRPMSASPQPHTEDLDESELPEFAAEYGQDYIYPTNYQLRTYQFDIVRSALFQNTLVCLPTGLGKTFIAAVVMYNFYRWFPTGKVVFMAPTKPLVQQQLEACFSIMGVPQNETVMMTGSKAKEYRRETWRCKRILFVTPQILQHDLADGVCNARDFVCVVVDEAHKALGDYAYCQVIRHMVRTNRRFRVLALSATPGSNMASVQSVIQNLLISHVEVRTEQSLDVRTYICGRKTRAIIIQLGDVIANIRAMLLPVLGSWLHRLCDRRAFSNRNPENVTKQQLVAIRKVYMDRPPDTPEDPQGYQHSKGQVLGDYAVAISLFHAFELLGKYGVRPFYVYLKSVAQGSKSGNRSRYEIVNNGTIGKIMNDLYRRIEPDAPHWTAPDSAPAAPAAAARAKSKAPSRPAASTALSSVGSDSEQDQAVVGDDIDALVLKPSQSSKQKSTSIVDNPKLAKMIEVVRDHFLHFNERQRAREQQRRNKSRSQPAVSSGDSSFQSPAAGRGLLPNGAGANSAAGASQIEIDGDAEEDGDDEEEEEEVVDTRVMIFSEFRESVQEIIDALADQQPVVRAMAFVGQATTKGSKGLTQEQQLRIMRAFRSGDYNTLVSTSVGEEGLDVGHVDLIVCFDSQASPTRMVQRMGRTGRKREGQIVMLLYEGAEALAYQKSVERQKSVQDVLERQIKSFVMYPTPPRMIPLKFVPKATKTVVKTTDFLHNASPMSRRRMLREASRNAAKEAAGTTPAPAWALTGSEQQEYDSNFAVEPSAIDIFAPTTAAARRANQAATIHGGRSRQRHDAVDKRASQQARMELRRDDGAESSSEEEEEEEASADEQPINTPSVVQQLLGNSGLGLVSRRGANAHVPEHSILHSSETHLMKRVVATVNDLAFQSTQEFAAFEQAQQDLVLWMDVMPDPQAVSSSTTFPPELAPNGARQEIAAPAATLSRGHRSFSLGLEAINQAEDELFRRRMHSDDDDNDSLDDELMNTTLTSSVLPAARANSTSVGRASSVVARASASVLPTGLNPKLQSAQGRRETSPATLNLLSKSLDPLQPPAVSAVLDPTGPVIQAAHLAFPQSVPASNVTFFERLPDDANFSSFVQLDPVPSISSRPLPYQQFATSSGSTFDPNAARDVWQFYDGDLEQTWLAARVPEIVQSVSSVGLASLSPTVVFRARSEGPDAAQKGLLSSSPVAMRDSPKVSSAALGASCMPPQELQLERSSSWDEFAEDAVDDLIGAVPLSMLADVSSSTPERTRLSLSVDANASPVSTKPSLSSQLLHPVHAEAASQMRSSQVRNLPIETVEIVDDEDDADDVLANVPLSNLLHPTSTSPTKAPEPALPLPLAPAVATTDQESVLRRPGLNDDEFDLDPNDFADFDLSDSEQGIPSSSLIKAADLPSALEAVVSSSHRTLLSFRPQQEVRELGSPESIPVEPPASVRSSVKRRHAESEPEDDLMGFLSPTANHSHAEVMAAEASPDGPQLSALATTGHSDQSNAPQAQKQHPTKRVRCAVLSQDSPQVTPIKQQQQQQEQQQQLQSSSQFQPRPSPLVVSDSGTPIKRLRSGMELYRPSRASKAVKRKKVVLSDDDAADGDEGESDDAKDSDGRADNSESPAPKHRQPKSHPVRRSKSVATMPQRHRSRFVDDEAEFGDASSESEAEEGAVVGSPDGRAAAAAYNDSGDEDENDLGGENPDEYDMNDSFIDDGGPSSGAHPGARRPRAVASSADSGGSPRSSAASEGQASQEQGNLYRTSLLNTPPLNRLAGIGRMRHVIESRVANIRARRDAGLFDDDDDEEEDDNDDEAEEDDSEDELENDSPSPRRQGTGGSDDDFESEARAPHHNCIGFNCKSLDLWQRRALRPRWLHPRRLTNLSCSIDINKLLRSLLPRPGLIILLKRVAWLSDTQQQGARRPFHPALSFRPYNSKPNVRSTHPACSGATQAPIMLRPPLATETRGSVKCQVGGIRS
ncbi:fanconi anemia, variant [Capsaspora owczarzaki ATCC 30864]|uniref:Fanconi anemia, variant n=1 Tax=Capsaspora owczarzaki (strain ATCC 30864) TaxID=595528 RepID=A0A0D2VNK6_CAPO3|nr:fanconi anemia, variant [Capsaspora owczarzaki ATCC 30864]